jgi:hypothetical protein
MRASAIDEVIVLVPAYSPNRGERSRECRAGAAAVIQHKRSIMFLDCYGGDSHAGGPFDCPTIALSLCEASARACAAGKLAPANRTNASSCSLFRKSPNWKREPTAPRAPKKFKDLAPTSRASTTRHERAHRASQTGPNQGADGANGANGTDCTVAVAGAGAGAPRARRTRVPRAAVPRAAAPRPASRVPSASTAPAPPI